MNFFTMNPNQSKIKTKIFFWVGVGGVGAGISESFLLFLI